MICNTNKLLFLALPTFIQTTMVSAIFEHMLKTLLPCMHSRCNWP